MNFVAIDVETANPDMTSICQIGLARYQHGLLFEEWKTYVDPEDYFDMINISIHGIDESTVKGAPKLNDLTDQLYGFLDGKIAVCHTHFDRVAIHQAFAKHNKRNPSCTWLDSARVARRTWKELAWRGYGLHNVCRILGYEFKHHDALEDAKAAAHVLLAAIDESNLSIEEWLQRVEKSIDIEKSYAAIKREGNPEGPLYGEVIVFTGSLLISRGEASDLAAKIGCKVDLGVTKKTTLLVVGDQDIKKLAGHEKSSKHRKAEGLISDGQNIRILRETDFIQLVNFS